MTKAPRVVLKRARNTSGALAVASEGSIVAGSWCTASTADPLGAGAAETGGAPVGAASGRGKEDAAMDTDDVEGPIAGVVGPEPHAASRAATASRAIEKAFVGLTD